MSFYHGYKPGGFRNPSSEGERRRYVYFHRELIYRVLPAALSLEPLSVTDALLSPSRTELIHAMLSAIPPFEDDTTVKACFSGRHVEAVMREVNGRPALFVTCPPVIAPGMCHMALAVLSTAVLLGGVQQQPIRYFTLESVDGERAQVCERNTSGGRAVVADVARTGVEEFLAELGKLSL